jgi:LysM repeat protein
MSSNGLANYNIYAGQRLMIPAGYSSYGYQPYYWYRPAASIYSPQPLPTVQLLPNPTFGCTYTVQPKDTVFSIAYRYQVGVPALMQANSLPNPLIFAGRPLYVPCLGSPPPAVITYTVQPGDNLFRIAIKYNSTIYALALVNGLCNSNLVFANQVLVIPYPGSYVWRSDIPTAAPPPTTTVTATVTATPTATPTTQAAVVITMQSTAFIPGTITINRGGTVLWKNLENFTHTVASNATVPPERSFHSVQLGNGQSFSFTFNTPGTYPYFSETDVNMTGTVIVQ